ncbi:hypothetical protein H5410_047298 [Solanum commersonii]|uniref:Uncharacterized protein n=1 Tax=Solanum commersonii TaxID=4109 RepID=A0A9J5XIR1_SOLCO|nr:hypothetical protein H5410_047298 [Solanum commersonii]
MRMQNKKLVERWVKIKYDYVPKYCQTCMIQGHNEEQCYVVHPFKEEDKKVEESKEDDKGKDTLVQVENKRKGDGFVKPRCKNWGGGRNKETQQVWNGVGIITENKFNLLNTGEADQSTKKIGRAVSSEHTISEVRSREQHAAPKNLQRDINGEESMTKNTDAGGRLTKGRECNPRNLFTVDYGEARDNCYKEGEIPKGLDLIEEDDEISKAGGLSPQHTNSLKYGVRKGRPIIPLHVKTRSSRDRGFSVDQ